jgi:hypothetical protein
VDRRIHPSKKLRGKQKVNAEEKAPIHFGRNDGWVLSVRGWAEANNETAVVKAICR